MIMEIQGDRKFHRIAWLLVLTLMASSLPLSKFTMSVFQFTILGMWLLFDFDFIKSGQMFKKQSFPKAFVSFISYCFQLIGQNFVRGFNIFFQNKAAIILVSIYLMHIVGLLWTTDFAYAFKDLRIKLPLLMFPVVLLGMPKLNSKQFYGLMGVYVLANFIGSLFSAYTYLKGDFVNIRDISIFISPIRFSLNICISIVFLVFLFLKPKLLQWKFKILSLPLIAWFIGILYLLESGIGFLILGCLALLYIAYLIKTFKSLGLRIVFSSILIAIPILVINFFVKEYKAYNYAAPIQWEKLPIKTAAGGTYVFDTSFMSIENGNYPGMYLCVPELRVAWNKKSVFPYDSLDRVGYNINTTLIRYLNSKGLGKDSIGISALNNQDIANIEKGIANHNYVDHPGIKTRLSKFFFGYQQYLKTKNPSNSSVFQRFEYWKAAKQIFYKSPLIGVGTGDIQKEFQQQYVQMDTLLGEQFRFRTHNQYLAILVTFGIIGFIWFLFALSFPAYLQGRYHDLFFVTFFVIITLSMLTEDTIESQAGATFFAFFFSFFLFSRKKNESLQ